LEESLWDKTGGLDLSLGLAADFELWTRFARNSSLTSVSVSLASFRVSPGQRSSVSRDEYEREVLQVCDKYNSPPLVWNYVSQFGIVWRSICRFFLWKSSPAVVFSEDQDEWILVHSYRPVSRASWAGLLLERSYRKLSVLNVK